MRSNHGNGRAPLVGIAIALLGMLKGWDMVIGERLRNLREQKKLSQGNIETRTGLLRCYISRVENGHTIPAIETLEKLARALGLPLYELLYDGDQPPEPLTPIRRTTTGEMWASSGKNARYLRKLRQCLSRMNEEDRKLLFFAAQKMAKPRKREKNG
jgi:transcriptional regulator with XRE-family HTH domain